MSEVPQVAEAQKPESQKTKPTKALPTERVAFAKQLDLLRAYAAAYGAGGKAVSNIEVAALLKMSPSTVSLNNTFYSEIGLLQKGDGGYVPSAEVVGYLRAYSWNPDKAAHKLGPALRTTWFATSLNPRLSYSPVEEEEAIGILADACGAAPEYKGQLNTLLDYLEAANVVVREGTVLRLVGPDASSPSGKSAQSSNPTADQKEPPAAKQAVSTSFAQSTEGVVAFNVSVRVEMSEFAGWDPQRITAFFAGVAQVLAAKGAIETAPK